MDDAVNRPRGNTKDEISVLFEGRIGYARGSKRALLVFIVFALCNSTVQLL